VQLGRQGGHGDVKKVKIPPSLRELITGSKILFECRGGSKSILSEEQPTIDFAYASVVSISRIYRGEVFTEDNLWVKRPGSGEILADEYVSILGKRAVCDIPDNVQIKREWVEE